MSPMAHAPLAAASSSLVAWTNAQLAQNADLCASIVAFRLRLIRPVSADVGEPATLDRRQGPYIARSQAAEQRDRFLDDRHS